MNNTQEQRPANSQSRTGGLGLVMVALLVSALLYGLFLYTSQQNQPTQPVEDSLGDLTQEERAELEAVGQEVFELYGSESAPIAPEGADTKNYGLEAIAESVVTLNGSLFITGLRAPSGIQHVYRYKMSQLDPSPQRHIADVPASLHIEYENPLMPGNFYAVLVSSDPDNLESDGMSIHSSDMQTETFTQVSGAFGIREQELEWSEQAGLLAYGRIKEQQTHSILVGLSLDGREINIVDPQTGESVLTIDGAQRPKWSPDGSKLLYMKTDGLYAHNFADGVEELILGMPEGGMVTGTSKYDLSPDGSHLVWTTAKEGMITVHEITSWEPVIINEIGRIKVFETEFYWPQFSPDGEYYVVQAIDTLKENENFRQNPRLEVRPVLSRTIVKSIPLEEFAFDALFTDDWVSGENLEES